MRALLPPPNQRSIELASLEQVLDLVNHLEDRSELLVENGVESLVIVKNSPYAMVKLREERRGGPIIYAINPKHRDSTELFQINDDDEVPLSVCIPFEWAPSIATHYFRTGKVPSTVTWLGPDRIRGFLAR